MVRDRDEGHHVLRDAIGLTVLFIVFYGCTAVTTAPAMLDGYSELDLATTVESVRPNHLWLSPLWRGLASLIPVASPRFAALIAAVGSNVAAGAIALGCWFVLARRLGTGRGVAAAAVLLLGFCSAPWSHSRDVESAMIAHAFFLSGFAVAASGRDVPGLRRGLLAGSLFGCATLFALNLAIFLPALLLLIVIRSSRGMDAAWAAASAGTAALALPFACLTIAHRSAGASAGFAPWLLHHPTADLMGSTAPGWSGTAFLRAWVGIARFFLPLQDGVPAGLKRMLSGQPGLPLPWAAVGEFALAAWLAIAIVVLGAMAIVRVREAAARFVPALVVLLGFVVNVPWLGSDPQFWLPVVPFLLIAALSATGPGPVLRIGEHGIPAVALPLIGVGGLVLALNFAWPTPTGLAPRGGAAWVSAGAFASWTTRPTLLLSSETPWTFFASARDPMVTRRSWLYSYDQLRDDYPEDVLADVDSVLARGGDVFVVDLFGEESLGGQATWENVRIAHGCSRSDLARIFGSRYAVREPKFTFEVPVSLRQVIAIQGPRRNPGHDLTPRPGDPAHVAR